VWVVRVKSGIVYFRVLLVFASGQANFVLGKVFLWLTEPWKVSLSTQSVCLTHTQADVDLVQLLLKLCKRERV